MYSELLFRIFYSYKKYFLSKITDHFNIVRTHNNFKPRINNLNYIILKIIKLYNRLALILNFLEEIYI